MFGPSVAGLKGYSSRKKTRGFPVERVSILANFHRLNKLVTLAADVMFVTGVPFLSLIWRRLNSSRLPPCPRGVQGNGATEGFVSLQIFIGSAYSCIAHQLTLGRRHNFCCLRPISNPRPVFDSPRKTTRGMLHTYLDFKKPQNMLVWLVAAFWCFPGVFTYEGTILAFELKINSY